MVLKTFYRRIRKSIPRLGASKKHFSIAIRAKAGRSEKDHLRDDVEGIPSSLLEPNEKSPQEELREEYQELIRTSYRMVRCLGDDLDSSTGSSYLSGHRYREQVAEDNLERTWPDKATTRTSNFVHRPIEVTHLMDDSDDEQFGLRFANLAAAENAQGDAELRDSSSVFIDIDDCRDTDTQCFGASPQRDGDNNVYYQKDSMGYF